MDSATCNLFPEDYSLWDSRLYSTLRQLNSKGKEMARFGQKSLAILKEVHPLLRKVLEEAIKGCDFSINEGYRNQRDQEIAFKKKNTKAHFGQSAHNYKPCVAVDCLPFPFKGWDDSAGFKAVADHILATAKKLNVPVRWGADWNMNGKTNDERFSDSPHFELHPWSNYVKKGK